MNHKIAQIDILKEHVLIVYFQVMIVQLNLFRTFKIE